MFFENLVKKLFGIIFILNSKLYWWNTCHGFSGTSFISSFWSSSNLRSGSFVFLLSIIITWVLILVTFIFRIIIGIVILIVLGIWGIFRIWVVLGIIIFICAISWIIWFFVLWFFVIWFITICFFIFRFNGSRFTGISICVVTSFDRCRFISRLRISWLFFRFRIFSGICTGFTRIFISAFIFLNTNIRTGTWSRSFAGIFSISCSFRRIFTISFSFLSISSCSWLILYYFTSAITAILIFIFLCFGCSLSCILTSISLSRIFRWAWSTISGCFSSRIFSFFLWFGCAFSFSIWLFSFRVTSGFLCCFAIVLG